MVNDKQFSYVFMITNMLYVICTILPFDVGCIILKFVDSYAWLLCKIQDGYHNIVYIVQIFVYIYITKVKS